MAGKFAALEVRMMEGMEALSADAEQRAARLLADVKERKMRMSGRLLADAEESEKRVAAKLLATEGIEAEMLKKAHWDAKQWTDLAEVVQRKRREIGEVRKAVEGIAAQAALAPLVLVQAEAEAVERVVATMSTLAGKWPKDPRVDSDDMGGLEWEGLFALQHAPETGTVALTPTPTPKDSEGKGKVRWCRSQ